MSDLPEGWAEATLGDVTTQRQEKLDPKAVASMLFLGMDDVENASGRIAQYKTTNGLKSKIAAFEAGDLLFGRLRPYLKKVVRPEQRGAASAEFIVFEENEGFDLELLKHLLLSEDFLHFTTQVSTGDRPRVSYKSISAFELKVPPAAEQKRIAAKIESLTAKSARARTELAKIEALVERYKAAVLERAFRGELSAEFRELKGASQTPVVGRLTSNLRQKYRLGAELDFIPPYEVPSSWRWLTMPQLGTLDRGKSKHRPRNDVRLFGGPYPFIQTGEVRSATQYIEEFIQAYSEFGLQQSRLWPAETVCITIAANIAETALLRFEACFPDSVVGFIADEGQIEPRYLEFFMRTMKAQLDQFAPATAQKNINLDVLAAVRIPTPPIGEQRLIVERIETAFNGMDHVVSKAKAANVATEKLNREILSKAFEGKLVPQKPDEEPASILLERLRSASQPKRPRQTKRPASSPAPRAHRKTSSMTKSRFDPDVAGKSYLSNLVKAPGSPIQLEELYQRAQLAMPDFYKQLAFEVDEGFLIEEPGGLMRRA